MSYCMWCCIVGCVVWMFWRIVVPGKHQQLHTHWHNVTSQKTWIFSSTTVRTSNLAPLFAPLLYYSVQKRYNDGLLRSDEQQPAYSFIEEWEQMWFPEWCVYFWMRDTFHYMKHGHMCISLHETWPFVHFITWNMAMYAFHFMEHGHVCL
jgi:hypothetical protein